MPKVAGARYFFRSGKKERKKEFYCRQKITNNIQETIDNGPICKPLLNLKAKVFWARIKIKLLNNQLNNNQSELHNLHNTLKFICVYKIIIILYWAPEIDISKILIRRHKDLIQPQVVQPNT